MELLTINPSGPYGVHECYIITKPLIGTTLADILDAQISDHSRLKLAAQMIEGLDFIHSSGCMHRDVKLDNILASTKPLQAIIIDFGHATWEEVSSDHMKGTVRYLAPEIVSIKHGKPLTYNRSADIWSMGLTIFELLNKWRFTHTYITEPAQQGMVDKATWNRRHKDPEMGAFFELLSEMLAWRPGARISAKDALDWVQSHGLLADSKAIPSAGGADDADNNIRIGKRVKLLGG